MIFLIGQGVKGYSQLTLEGLQTLKIADKVLTFSNDIDFFRNHQIVNVDCISELYRDGDRDQDNYDRIISRIVDEHSSHLKLAVLLPGHPRLGTTICQLLETLCYDRSVDFQVIEGLSSFDTMINDLRRDPLEKGSVVLDVNRYLLFDMHTDPLCDHYFYHVCSVATPYTHVSNPSKNNRIDLLQEKLLHNFPKNHPVYLLRSSTEQKYSSRKIMSTIENIQQLLSRIDFSTTLFIPGLNPKRLNKEFLNLIQEGT